MFKFIFVSCCFFCCLAFAQDGEQKEISDEAMAAFAKYTEKLAIINSLETIEEEKFLDRALGSEPFEGVFIIGSFGGHYTMFRFKGALREYLKLYDIPNVEAKIREIDRAIINHVFKDISNQVDQIEFISRKAENLGFKGKDILPESKKTDNPKNFDERRFLSIKHNGFVIRFSEPISGKDFQDILRQKPNPDLISKIKITVDLYEGDGFFRDKEQLKNKIFVIDKTGSFMGSYKVDGSQEKNKENMEFTLVPTITDNRKKILIEKKDNNDNNGFSVLSKRLAGLTLNLSGQPIADKFADTSGHVTVQSAKSWSPIIVDLDGNFVADVNRSMWKPHQPNFFRERTVYFDIDADGNKEHVEWLGDKDGLLVVPNEDMSISDSHNLFSNTGGYRNGYDKLQQLFDKDGNYWIEGDELSGIFVWCDKNSNAQAEEGELTSLEDMGISAIYTKHHDFVSFLYMHGKKTVTWDWWPSFVDDEMEE